MGAKKKPLEKLGAGDVGIDAVAGRRRRLAASTAATSRPARRRRPGTIIEDEDTDETVEKIVAWLDERKLI